MLNINIISCTTGSYNRTEGMLLYSVSFWYFTLLGRYMLPDFIPCNIHHTDPFYVIHTLYVE